MGAESSFDLTQTYKNHHRILQSLKPVQPKMNGLEAKPRTSLVRLGSVLCHICEPGKQAGCASSHYWGPTTESRPQ